MDSHSIIDQFEGGFPRRPKKGDQVYRYIPPDLTFDPFGIYRYGGKARGWSFLQRQPGFKKDYTVSDNKWKIFKRRETKQGYLAYG
jgi:hypothetical protein